ncbi:hypothetical protein F5888DRAFT_1655479 [Russula emetica]|nr:hypothetical protein F5888DRAFT_1655479 [Russula emetica]
MSYPIMAKETPANPRRLEQSMQDIVEPVISGPSKHREPLVGIASAPVVPSQPATVSAPAPAPAVPKTWDNLAATNRNSTVAQKSRGTSEVPAASSSHPGSGTQTPESYYYVPSARPQNQSREPHPKYVAASNVSNALCFVKGVQENVTEAAMRNALVSQFGPIKNLDLVRKKACAFLEFSNVDAARRAIVASLPASQGGEGGIRIDVGDGQQVRITVETRKKRGGRPVSRPRGGTLVNSGGTWSRTGG